MKKVLITLSLIVVAVAGGPLLTAKVAKDNLELEVSRINEALGYTAELVDYNKSWFNATAQIRMGMDDALWSSLMAGNPAVSQLQISVPNIIFDLEIAHGPLCFGDAISVGLVRIDGTLNESDMPELTEFRKKIGVESLLTYSEVFNLFGSGSYQVSSPAFDYKDDKAGISFGGMDVHGNFDLKYFSMTMDGGLAEIRIVENSPAITVIIEPITITADMEVVSQAVLLGDMEVVLPGIKAYMGADTTGQPTMTINNLKVATNSHYDGDNTIAGSVIYSLGEVTGQGMSLQDLMIDLSVEHFSVKATEQIMDLYRSAISNIANIQQIQGQLAMSGAALAPEILKYSPVFSISDFSFKLNGEPLKADARIEFGGEGMDSANLNPQLLIQNLIANLNVKLSDALMQQFGPMMGGQQAMFEKTADGYSVKFVMKDGTATLNGQPLPPLF